MAKIVNVQRSKISAYGMLFFEKVVFLLVYSFRIPINSLKKRHKGSLAGLMLLTWGGGMFSVVKLLDYAFF